ncbi:MAG: hypothetical protein ACRD16_11485 [Thermoanaerobaculia bacterium]
MIPVVFAPTIAAARTAGGNFREFLSASPRSDTALDRALAQGLPVRFWAPRDASAFWTLVRRRYWLPGAPSVLRDAIGGIARRSEPETRTRNSAQHSPSGGAEALWIEGALSDSRARSLLREGTGPRLWVIEDFRKLLASDALLNRVQREGIHLAVLRPLRASVLRSRK